jgi:hypothetical protein
VGGGFVGGRFVEGGLVGIGCGGEVGVLRFFRLFVMVGGMGVREGEAVADATGVVEGVTVGEKVRVGVGVSEGTEVLVAITTGLGLAVKLAELLIVGVREAPPVPGMKLGS